MLGQLLDGRYRIERELGAGGFGKTYLAQDTLSTGQLACVVKQLQPQSTEPYFLKIANRLFQQEAEVLKQLGNHGQIPGLLKHFEFHQEFFLVQEFIDGHDLASEITVGRKWSETEAKALLEEVLAPLAAAHQKQVIHRDIKPANLMRRKSDGRIFLIDFGAVKQVAVTQVNHLKQVTTVGIGTDGYMPIEQRLGKPHLGGSDVYALGIVILQALTGVQDAASLMDADIAQVQWRHLTTVSPAFGEILDKMVTNGVVNRYQSAMEVMAALKLPVAATRVGQPVANHRVSTTTMLQNPPKVRVGSRLWLGLLGWMAIVGMLIWAWPKGANPIREAVNLSPVVSPAPSPDAAVRSSATPSPSRSVNAPLPSPTIVASANSPNTLPTGIVAGTLPSSIISSTIPSYFYTVGPGVATQSSYSSGTLASSQPFAGMTETTVLPPAPLRANTPPSSASVPIASARQRQVATATNPSNDEDSRVSSLPADSTLLRRAAATPSDDRLSGVPDFNELPSTESTAAKSVRKYFEVRWRADPNFQESLQYQIRINENGQVRSIEGQTEISRTYLNRTNFLRPGEQISGSIQSEQGVWLILNPTGEVQALAKE